MLIAKTTDMTMMRPTPNRLAAKKAGMPSTMGDEPRINNNAVRAVVLCRCTCGGGSAAVLSLMGCDVSGV